MKFNIPSKTFIVGEYVALDGGPAIVYSHEPSFTFELVEGSGEHPFHPQSPAGRFIKNNQDFFAKHNIFFSDPYQGRGGFGASTAQFIGCYLSLNSMSIPMMPEEIFKAVDVYCSLFSAEEVVPSGYDVAAQMGSGFAVINKQERNIDFVSWPFANVDLTLYKTNDKQNTHEHLKAVSVGDKASLRVAAQLVVKTFVQKDLPSFLQGLQLFSLALQKNNLIYSATENELKKITAQPNVLYAKGCGALGADVIAVLTQKGFLLPKKETENLLKVISTHESPLAPPFYLTGGGL